MVGIRISKKVAIFIVCFIITFLIVGAIFYKPPLRSADKSELDVYGVGEILMARIEKYISKNPNAKVEDLLEVKGVGRNIVDQLQRRFR